MFEKLQRRITRSLDKADVSIGKINSIADAVKEILKEGISFKLEIMGEEVPIKVIMEPDDADTP